MTDIDQLIGLAKRLPNNVDQSQLRIDLPQPLKDRIMGIDTYVDPRGEFEVSEVLVAEALAYVQGDGQDNPYFLSTLISSGNSGSLEADFSAGRFLRPNYAGNMVFAVPGAHGELKGIGPFHSIAIYMKREMVEVRLRELGREEDTRLDVLSSKCLRDASIQTLMWQLLEAQKWPAYAGKHFDNDEILDGICRQLLRLANRKTAEHRFRKGSNPSSIENAIEYMHANYRSDICRKDLANAAELGPRHFTELFRHVMGQTPKRYLVSLRIDHARVLLRHASGLTISQIATECGFFNTSHLCREFRREVGTTPATYRDHFR